MITCYYSCPECGLKKVAVEIPAREHAEIDVVKWMKETVIPITSADHHNRSPHCHPKELKDLMIPCTEDTEFLGQQVD